MTNFTIKADDIDFSDAAQVISSAQKFVLPVPAFYGGGEPLVYPQNAVDKTGNSIAGNPITDWQGKPIGDAGIVFFNGKDKSWQAATGEGSSVVIMNQVTEDQAAKLAEKIQRVLDKKGIEGRLEAEQQTKKHLHFSNSIQDALDNLDKRTVKDLSVSEFKEVLKFACEDLGLSDMYNSDQTFIAGKMSRVGNDTGVAGFGLHKRDDRDICQAVYIAGEGEFQGPAASPQQFQNGAVIVKQSGSVRLVQPEIFTETYRGADGAKLDIMDVPSVIVKGATSGIKTGPSAPTYNKA